MVVCFTPVPKWKEGKGETGIDMGGVGFLPVEDAPVKELDPGGEVKGRTLRQQTHECQFLPRRHVGLVTELPHTGC